MRQERTDAPFVIRRLIGLLALTVSIANAQSPPNTTWVNLSPATEPSARSGPGMCFDKAQNLVVLFGGLSQTFSRLNDTWTFDGQTWTQLQPADSPPARQGPDMAYDHATRRVVLFGGTGQGSQLLTDTWVWNGSNWKEIHPASSPNFTVAAPAFTDPLNGHVDVFTERPSGSPQTWRWTGSNWIELATPVSPPARYFATTAFDEASANVMLYGGVDALGNALSDTWTWNGTNWNQVITTANPGPAELNAALYDRQLGAVIMPNWSTSPFATWEWTGNDWLPLQPSKNPQYRFNYGLAPNPETGKPVLFGGAVVSGANQLSGTWQFDVAK